MFFGSKSAKTVAAKMDQKTEQIFDFTQKLKELKVEVESKEQELTQERRKHQMVLDEALHKQKLSFMEKEASFERSKANWEEDKKKAQSGLVQKEADIKAQLESAYKIKEQEAFSLVKLDSEQRIKQAELNSDRKIQELSAKHNEETVNLKLVHTKELSDTERKLSEEYYDKLKEALAKLHTEGNLTTDFLREMTFKLLDRAPALQASEIKFHQHQTLPTLKG